MDIETCCGAPMLWREVFGIRIYTCTHRSHHPEVFVNLNTGERRTEEELEWNDPD
jgi:hypothetical protein